MNMYRQSRSLAVAGLLALLAACATQKAPEPAVPTTAAPPAASAPTQTPAAADKGAQTSAVGNDAALQAQQMADDKARAEREAAARASQAAQAQLSTRVFYFDYDSSDIKTEGYQSLKAHAAWLAKHPDARVRVEGNCDERGTREYNMALGERRAQAVAAYLSSNGASAGQLTIVSYGKEKPADDGHDEAAWAKNRRVELDYTAGQP